MAVIAANIQKLGQPVFDKDKIKAWSDRAAEFYSQFEGVEYCGTHILSRNKVW